METLSTTKLSEREIQLMELKCRLDSLNSSSEELAKKLTTEKIEELNSLMNNLSLVFGMQSEKLNLIKKGGSKNMTKKDNQTFNRCTSIKKTCTLDAINLLTKI